MLKHGLSLALLSTSALAGCGSHAHAPVVYGTAPTARFYNSPNDIAAERRLAAQPRYGAPAPSYGGGISPAVSAGGPAPLTPVTETWSEGRQRYGAQPVYLAAAEPAAFGQPSYEQSAYEPSAETLPGRVSVLPGDTVYAISRRTGASPQAIIALNRLAPPYALEIGEIIRVPSNAVPPSHAPAEAPRAPGELRRPRYCRVCRRTDPRWPPSRESHAPNETPSAWRG